MAKRLVLDRTINLRIPDRGEIRVPESELWKITLTHTVWCEGNSELSTETNHLIGEGTTITNSGVQKTQVVGIAFKIVEA